MLARPVEVTAAGAVVLGGPVVCDGFHYNYDIRVQTHVHDDHMHEFDRSKGFQDIFMTGATKELLVCEFDADLPYRNNIFVVEPGKPVNLEEASLTVLSSGHMLGAVQVALELASGLRVGYSGDFQWPLNDVIGVDALVVDSTYGSPRSTRRFSQDEAETCFIDLVMAKLKEGPVHVTAWRGTIQRALGVVSATLDCPLVGSERFCREVQVYREHGYGISELIRVDSGAGKDVIRDGQYIRFYTKGDAGPIDVGRGCTIALSAYMSSPDTPLLVYSDRAFRVAFSNHADFNGTLEYVQATGARFVLTDNSRGGPAIELAREINARLGIEAEPSMSDFSKEWGA